MKPVYPGGRSSSPALPLFRGAPSPLRALFPHLINGSHSIMEDLIHMQRSAWRALHRAGSFRNSTFGSPQCPGGDLICGIHQGE